MKNGIYQMQDLHRKLNKDDRELNYDEKKIIFFSLYI